VVETRPTRDLIREPERLGASLTTRFRDALEALPVALMRDMWLTGFDTPSLHTMDVDKPMRSHALMQVMARETSIQGPGRRARGGLPLGLAQERRWRSQAMRSTTSPLSTRTFPMLQRCSVHGRD
jgi:hypothetical protein